jgi:hypothetical protein
VSGTETVIAALILPSILLYFLPTVVATWRGHRNPLSIFILNLFLGWTFIGWVVALVWATTNDREGAWQKSRC